MHRRDFLSSTAAIGAVAALPGFARAQAAVGSGDAALTQLFDQVFQAALPRSPELATQLGFDNGPNAALKRRLSDRGAQARARDASEVKKAIGAIEDVAPKTLSPAARLDREVVLYSLRSQTTAWDRFKLGSVLRPFTIFQQGGAYFSTPDFLNSAHTVTTAEDAEAYLARLDAFAAVLDQESAVQAEEAARGYLAPDFSLDLTLRQMAALRAPAAAENNLTTSLARRAAAAGIAGDWSARAAAIVEDKVYPALDRQQTVIARLREGARSSAGIWEVPQGAEIYAAALAQATTTTLTPAEVHQMGIEQVAEIGGELDTILKAQGLTSGSVAARLNALNARPEQLYPDTPAGREQLIASLNADNAAMQAKLGAMFDLPPDAPLDIRAVPAEIQDGASNGYYRRAALDGSRPAIYFINLKSVADWPKYTLPSLTYHEGVPGHHLQISIAQGATAPLLRKIGFFGAYTEGWALYAESVADELGGYATPLDRAGFLQSYLFRAARLVIDTGLHHHRWTREKATDYLVETVGFARPRSLREVERYCTQPGQACSYKIGHTSWLRARAKAQAIMGERFDVKAFHDILSSGAMPLTIFERLVEERANAAMG
ncbi:DUF885 domain-containing protein [Sphingomonas qomolangmaensis]|uniref:DUF885 family protein n=1 Tax=Sphingomonas qomolangmaensis TaxID=2918765 RepID=A0ABY5L7P3_9SPHN|nr:DUF885 family protein [Sphingomonas qomolangmaensis]UUL81765.1 DUF885 family protein [Sphingomonas qomolangmaensis]